MARYEKGGDVVRVPQINSEFEKIQEAFQDTLSRKGDNPNQMEAPIDMNGERILNLPEPLNGLEPVRLQDFNSFIEEILRDNVEDSGSNTYQETLTDGQVTVVSTIPIGESLVFISSDAGDSGLLVPEVDYSFAGNTLTLTSTYPDAILTVARIKKSFNLGTSEQAGLPFIYAKDEGILGSETEAGLFDENEVIQAAINKAVAEKKLLVFEGGRHYSVNGVGAVTNDVVSFGILATGAQPAYFHQQSSGFGVIRVEPQGNPVNGLSLAASVSPNQSILSLNDTSNLAPGMTLQLSSDKEWPYDGRGRWLKGELFTIDRIIDSTTVEVISRSYDQYDLGTENITVQAWTPSSVLLQNIEVIQNIRDTDASTTCITVVKCRNALLNKVTVRDSANRGILLARCVDSTLTNIECYNHGKTGSLGYGVYVQSCLNTLIDNIRGHACRRLVDLNSRPFTDSAPTRRTIIRNIFYSGGGVETFNSVPYWPNGSVSTDGVGTHGPAEDTLIDGGIISDCFTGVTARGRNTRIRNLEFSGQMKDCIGYSYGTGLDIQGCTVNNNTAPDRVDSVSTNPLTFLRIGNSSSIFGGVDYTLPVIVKNNTCVGLRESFIKFNSVTPVENFQEEGNTVYPRPGDGETFFYLHSPLGTIDISDSTLMGAVAGSFRRFSGTGSVGLDTNITLGRSDSTFSPVRVAESTWIAYIEDNSNVLVSPSRFATGLSTHLSISGSTDSTILCNAFILPNDDTLIDAGYVGSNVEASAGGLTGTTGTNGKLTVHWSSTGTLSVENRRGAPVTLKLTVEG